MMGLEGWRTTIQTRTRPQSIMMGLEGKEDYNPETPCKVSALCSDLYSTNEQVVLIVTDDVLHVKLFKRMT